MWVYTGRQTVNISTAFRIDIDRENAGAITEFSVTAFFATDKIKLASVEYSHPALNYKDKWENDADLRFIEGMNLAMTECEECIHTINASLGAGDNFCDLTKVYQRIVLLREDGTFAQA